MSYTRSTCNNTEDDFLNGILDVCVSGFCSCARHCHLYYSWWDRLDEFLLRHYFFSTFRFVLHTKWKKQHIAQYKSLLRSYILT